MKKQDFKKSLGQNFLVDTLVIDHIVNLHSFEKDDLILEIGPGHGALTKEILKKKFEKYIAVELDSRFATELRKIRDDRFKVIELSILDYVFDDNKYIIFGNLPYNITSAIFNFFAKNKQYIEKAIVMIQDEVALKFAKAKGRDVTPFSLFIQYHFDIRLCDKVLPESFFPTPKVNSRVLILTPKESLLAEQDEKVFFKFLEIGFNMPRRTLLNNLKGTHFLEKLPEAILRLRGQELILKELIDLYNQYIKS